MNDTCHDVSCAPLLTVAVMKKHLCPYYWYLSWSNTCPY